jgi:hypothetical protein
MVSSATAKPDKPDANYAPPTPKAAPLEASARVAKRYSIFKYEDFEPVLPDAK